MAINFTENDINMSSLSLIFWLDKVIHKGLNWYKVAGGNFWLVN